MTIRFPKPNSGSSITGRSFRIDSAPSNTPADVHYGRAAAMLEVRHYKRLAAFDAHPERFVHGPPRPETLPQMQNQVVSNALRRPGPTPWPATACGSVAAAPAGRSRRDGHPAARRAGPVGGGRIRQATARADVRVSPRHDEADRRIGAVGAAAGPGVDRQLCDLTASRDGPQVFAGRDKLHRQGARWQPHQAVGPFDGQDALIGQISIHPQFIQVDLL